MPDKDVIFISVGDSQQGRLNALHRGSVSATVLTPPFSGMAKQFGLHELADLRKSDIEYAGSAIAGMGSYIRRQPQLVENFLKGYIESLNFLRTEKEQTLGGIMKFLKMEDRARRRGVQLLCRHDAGHALCQRRWCSRGVAVLGRCPTESGDGQPGRILRQQFPEED